MNSKYIFILLFIMVFIIFLSCDKDKVSYGTLNVTVYNENKVLPHAKVYIKQGTLTNPNIPLDHYDASSTTDINGYASFTHLAPDKYFIFVQGLSIDSNMTVSGLNSISILQRYRGDNSYTIDIETN